MDSFFSGLFNYCHHSNTELALHILNHHKQVDEEVYGWMSHILCAHNIWNARILKHEPEHEVWDKLDKEKWIEIDTRNAEITRYIMGQMDLHGTIEYKSTSGIPYKNTVKDILFHVINHSTHHRAQIASSMRKSGIPGLKSDYIFYKRELTRKI
ncbi:MAG: DinB family protein [Luteibaculum sp.]